MNSRIPHPTDRKEAEFQLDDPTPRQEEQDEDKFWNVPRSEVFSTMRNSTTTVGKLLRLVTIINHRRTLVHHIEVLHMHDPLTRLALECPKLQG